MNQRTIARVQKMEVRYNRVKKVTDALEEALDNYLDVQNDIRLLDRYEYNGLWLRDFEADEKGQIPKDMARGILSEDGLYDLLIQIELLNNRMFENFVPLDVEADLAQMEEDAKFYNEIKKKGSFNTGSHPIVD